MKVELELHENQRSGGDMRMFGFGDSKSNDGNGEFKDCTNKKEGLGDVNHKRDNASKYYRDISVNGYMSKGSEALLYAGY